MSKRISFVVAGVVQGVGYRMFAQRRAGELGITGFVRNVSSGDVQGEAQGPDDALKKFMGYLQRGPQGSRVDSLTTNAVELQTSESSFSVGKTT
ncbi:Acylphosphatase-like domain-containing protein [Auriculariales sp. MPI-PUGE-AT-0066]|nr:Acylphosphatase-like domain-containing protein [Auriculariales sp. MPI-PUGE-AT-0066]